VAASYRCQLVSKEEVTMTLARSRRMLLVAVGLSVAVAAFPATAAHAGQPPAGETQLTQGPTSQPPVDLVPPGDPVPVDPPVDDILYPPDQPEPPQPPDPPVGPDDLANPTENPDPEPEPPDDLANPTENPEPQPPDDGDQSIPTPERVDTGLGGEADRSDGPAVPVAAFPLALAVLLLALVAGWRLGATRSAR
jgi:outer membrane biosynthesis protein TonB